MRLIFYMGKGGVGKTTIAAATALRCAEIGYRTLIVSTDLAHSLADVLDKELASKPMSVTTNLWGQEINVLDEMRTYWHELRNAVAVLLQRRGVSPVAAEELSIAPGMEEIVSLLRIHREILDGSFDVIIVDAAPTADTVRLLTMPETFRWYASRLIQWNEAPPVLARTFVGLPVNELIDFLTRIDSEVKELRQVLINPELSSYRVVFNPEKLAIKETERAISYMSMFDYPVDAGIINRVLPNYSLSSDPYLRRMQEIQKDYLQIARDTFTPLPLFEAQWYSEEVVGAPALARLSRSLWNDYDPTRVFWRGHIQSIEQHQDEYVLRLPLSHVKSDEVKVTKRGDELFISIGSFKRELSLPHVLAIREATTAQLTDDGSLEIRFALTTA